MVHSLVSGNDCVVSIIDPSAASATHNRITKEALFETDVVIDFSHPSAVLANVRLVSSFSKNIVMGTTGWYDEMQQVRNIVSENGIGFLYASNFSVGVQLFLKLAKRAGELFNAFSQYDVFIHEFHHNQKADSPSGTAMSVAQALIAAISRKKEILAETSRGKISPEKLHVTSTRGGHVPGTHEIFFDSEADTIGIRHEARSRIGFAAGAISCARWLSLRRGFFTIDDFISEIIP